MPHDCGLQRAFDGKPRVIPGLFCNSLSEQRMRRTRLPLQEPYPIFNRLRGFEFANHAIVEQKPGIAPIQFDAGSRSIANLDQRRLS
jgi:hypothetical protein